MVTLTFHYEKISHLKVCGVKCRTSPLPRSRRSKAVPSSQSRLLPAQKIANHAHDRRNCRRSVRKPFFSIAYTSQVFDSAFGAAGGRFTITRPTPVVQFRVCESRPLRLAGG